MNRFIQVLPTPLVTSVLAFALSACAAPVGGGTSLADALRTHAWTLTHLGDAAALPGADFRMAPAERGVSGNTTCNRFNGNYTLEGASLRFSMASMTKRACAEPERQEQESRYLDAMRRVERWEINGDQLALIDAQGKIVARFARSATK